MNFLPMDEAAMFAGLLGFLLGVAAVYIFHSKIADSIGALEERLLAEFRKSQAPNASTTASATPTPPAASV